MFIDSGTHSIGAKQRHIQLSTLQAAYSNFRYPQVNEQSVVGPHVSIEQRVSTPFQPNVGLSGIDLSGGGC